MSKPASATVEVCRSPEWIEANAADFRPPVCNKAAFTQQLKVFFVGGPNQRRDFHLEVGEELFYQIKGDMTLRVVDRKSGGKQRDIPIREGEIFLLPARVEHSPQRFAQTVGCVIERDRADTELDCLRYFTDDEGTRLLWQQWFYLEDVVKDLPLVIRAFQASEESKTGKPASSQPGTPEGSFQPDSSPALGSPFNLGAFIDDHLSELSSGDAPLRLYSPPTHSTWVSLYGCGVYPLTAGESAEMVVMPQRGEAKIHHAVVGSDGVVQEGKEAIYSLEAFHMARVGPGSYFQLVVQSGGVVLTVEMPPKGAGGEGLLEERASDDE